MGECGELSDETISQGPGFYTNTAFLVKVFGVWSSESLLQECHLEKVWVPGWEGTEQGETGQ